MMAGGKKAGLPALLTRPWFWVMVALVPRLLYLVEQGTTSPLFFHPLLDELESVESARAILDGVPAEEPLFKAPGYALILAAVMWLTGDAWPWMIRLLQHLCGALLAGITVSMASRMAPAKGRNLAAIAAGVIISFYGPLIRLESCLLLDFWSVFLQTAMMAALVAALPQNWKRQMLLATALAGAAILVRPTLLAALPALAVASGWMVGRWSTVGGVVAGVVLLLGPAAALMGMSAYNNRTGGTMVGQGLVLPWQGGYSFYQANKIGANGRFFSQASIDTSGGANPARELAIEGYRKDRRPDAFRIVGFYRDLNQFWMDKAWKEIKTDPARWLRLMFSKGVNLFAHREIFNIEEYEVHQRLSSILPYCFIRFPAVWIFALGGLASLGLRTPSRSRRYTIGWVYVLSLGAGIALYFVSGRMRMPLVPVLAAVGVAGCAAGEIGKRSKLLLLPLAAIAMIWSYGNWFGVNSENMAHVDYLRLSNAAWREGNHQRALQFAEEAEKLEPSYPTIPLLKAQAYYGLGDYTAALAGFTEASRRLPEDPVAAYNIAVLHHYHFKDHWQALEAYRRTLALKPDHHRAAWGAALMHLQARQITQAEALLEPYRAEMVKPKPAPALKAAALLLESARSGNELQAGHTGDETYDRQVMEELEAVAN